MLEIVSKRSPDPAAGEVLVQVHRSSVNPTDVKHRQLGRYLGTPPFTLGWDVAGYVAGIGEGVAHLMPGERVFGMLPYPYGAGAHAEYVTAPSRCFVALPEVVDLDQAGVAPLVGLTAYQAALEIGQLRQGQTVLIHGVGGAVGAAAAQIARSSGAHVVGVASRCHEWLSGLADELLVRDGDEWLQRVGAVDLVIDTSVADGGAPVLGAMRAGARYVSLLPARTDPAAISAARARGADARSMLVSADHAGMRRVAEMMESTALSFTIARAFSLDEISAAHSYAESPERAFGRVLIRVA
ncbi:quinone oxidoreductase family protein [Agrococcus sp. TSP3-2-1]|uniref:quinone oxidoreductase family protein n=1 Tax=Agrococcus sp. TSP3-2-1 TaxID=2804583 RepID=UPI003CF766DC